VQAAVRSRIQAPGFQLEEELGWPRRLGGPLQGL
jgi:hypothetical protein